MIKKYLFVIVCLLGTEYFHGQEIAILWKKGEISGTIEVTHGQLDQIRLIKGKGKISLPSFSATSGKEIRLELSFHGTRTTAGPEPSIVTIRSRKNPFSFFLRDVHPSYPVYLPAYEVIVTSADDKRSYDEIETGIRRQKRMTRLEQIEAAPEESFASAAENNRKQVAPVWLGLSRDIRIFEITGTVGSDWRESECITPRNASSGLILKEFGHNEVNYTYATGRGIGVENRGERRLENGILPVLHTTLYDEEVSYHTISFVSLESSPLTPEHLQGTHFLVADHYSVGHMFTPAQQEMLSPLLQADSMKEEETVLYTRIEAMNTASVPRYAFFKTVRPGYGWWNKIVYRYDKKRGMSVFSSGRVFAISKLNGSPLPNEEIAILLQPGEKATLEFYLPHQPLSQERAEKLSAQSFEDRLAGCISFWNTKLSSAASFSLPEKRIDEMVRAGLLHLDFITYGQEPSSTLAPCIGVYSPIGTESSPIIQFYCSMGWYNIARRSLQYFLDKQHENGMMQNFGGYMVETGAALYTIGEYFRYTRDTAWIKDIALQLLKSCDYLLAWRERNKKENLRGKGYGMIEGKVADPEDHYHQYMLNAYACLGLSRTAEMLAAVNPSQAKKLKTEVLQWKNDIRQSLMQSLAYAPVIPMGDGSWTPTVPSWTEAQAPQILLTDSGSCFSHGSFTVRDALIGPLYLVFGEILEPRDPVSIILLNYHSELLLMKNTAFSQPYYTRNDWLQLKLGMVKPFLKTYYNALSALADRETYTFYEHLHHVSVHKTHEEGWFLMQTRWMLYMEEKDTLKIFPGVPRTWLEDGKTITVQRAGSYFGPVSFHLSSQLNKGYIEITAETHDPQRLPKHLLVRVPHPQEEKAVRVSEGIYDAAKETVLISNFSGKTKVVLWFSERK